MSGYPQRDVPGLTRAAVPFLTGQGVHALSVGVNGGSAPPGVPHNTPFWWRDAATGTNLLAFWHPGGGFIWWIVVFCCFHVLLFIGL